MGRQKWTLIGFNAIAMNIQGMPNIKDVTEFDITNP